MKLTYEEMYEAWRQEISWKDRTGKQGSQEGELNANWKGGISRNYKLRVGTYEPSKTRRGCKGGISLDKKAYDRMRYLERTSETS